MRKPLTAKVENGSKKSGLHVLMIRVFAVMIVVAIISSLIIFHPWSLSHSQPVKKGPEVEGNLTYILPSNVSGAFQYSTFEGLGLAVGDVDDVKLHPLMLEVLLFFDPNPCADVKDISPKLNIPAITKSPCA